MAGTSHTAKAPGPTLMATSTAASFGTASESLEGATSPPVRSPALLRFNFPENFLKLVNYPKYKGNSVKGSLGGASFFDHLELEFLVSPPVPAA